jgi:hypothetical protein
MHPVGLIFAGCQTDVNATKVPGSDDGMDSDLSTVP